MELLLEMHRDKVRHYRNKGKEYDLLLYCIEMMNAKKLNVTEKAIYEKYKIPALVSKIDYVKTYANYILTTLKVAKWVSNEMDSNYCTTGRAKIVLSNNKTVFLTNEELLTYVGNIFRSNKSSEDIKYFVQNANESFLEFLVLIVPEIVEEHHNCLEEENGKSI